MKKLLTILLVCLFLLSGCGSSKPNDGVDRPSTAGQLQVTNGLLSDSKGNPVMLRGISFAGVSMQERYINEDTFKSIATDLHCNIVRMALYTYGVGVFGYCTGGNKDKLKDDIVKAVDAAEKADIYCLVDWHILRDMDPNVYLDDAVDFFDDMSKNFKDKKNVIYEICNEPNSDEVTWDVIKEYADVIIPIIRANDPDSLIIVGTPGWSSQLQVAVDDPLDYENIMYTYHFYSASNKEESRQGVKMAAEAGLPIFVTEFGITANTGGHPRDIESADAWIDLLEEYNISYVMWNFSTSGEACAAIKPGTLNTSGFSEEQLTETGVWLVENNTRRAEASLNK